MSTTSSRLLQLLSLLLGRPFGTGPTEQAFKFASYFENEQLITRVDVGDENTLAR